MKTFLFNEAWLKCLLDIGHFCVSLADKSSNVRELKKIGEKYSMFWRP